MISLRQSIKELDEAEVAHHAAAKAFAEVLETSAEHVVEVNRQEAEEFREQVLSLAGRVSHSRAAQDLDAARSEFRGELRGYSEKARAQLKRLREELSAAAAAMQTFAQGVSSSTGEHETLLRREFRQLQESAEYADIGGIRAAVHETVHVVTESYEGLKQAQALVVAQLRDEIRVLQSEVERGQRRLEPPPGTIPRRVMDREIEELLRQDRAFAVVIAASSESSAGTMVEKLAGLAREHVPKAAVAAWSASLYGVIVTTGAPVDQWRRSLAVPLDVVDRRSGEAPAPFFERLAKATETLTKSSAKL
jgi:hypothetical protein